MARDKLFFSLKEDLTIHILKGLGREYDSLVVPLTTRSSPLPLDDLFGLLLTHEHRLEHHDLATFAPIPSSSSTAGLSPVLHTDSKGIASNQREASVKHKAEGQGETAASIHLYR